MPGSDRTETTRLARAGLTTLIAGMLLLTGWVLFPGHAAAVLPGIPGNCPPGGVTAPATVNGVSVSVSGQSVVVSGGSANVCVKAANCHVVLTLGPGTHSGIVGWAANDNTCQTAGPPFPGISHVQVYSGTPTSTSPPSSSTTPPSSSTTPPSSSTSVAPTTITPPDETTPPGGTAVSPTTVTPPGGTAFTGLENVVPLGAIALTMMTAGSGLLWAGTRRNRKDNEEE